METMLLSPRLWKYLIQTIGVKIPQDKELQVFATAAYNLQRCIDIMDAGGIILEKMMHRKPAIAWIHSCRDMRGWLHILCGKG